MQAAWLAAWLAKLEELADCVSRTARTNLCYEKPQYLWPRTPTANLQAEIWQRCGASDLNEHDCLSRPYKIVYTLRELVDNRLIDVHFSILDVCCGDAVVLTSVKRAFPVCDAFGIDIAEYGHHSLAKDEGVLIYKVPLQLLVVNTPLHRFDVVMMLNTYRGWESADLKGDDLLLPYRVDDWLYKHARFAILTATNAQISRLKRRGFWVWEIGSGEDDSTMIGMFPGSMDGV